MQNLNITIELLRRYSSSKRMKELLGVAMWMKMQHSNGVMWNVTAYRLRKSLKIGKAKADRILKDMERNDLFVIRGKDVHVMSFRDQSPRRNRRGKDYRGAMVCKFPVRSDYTLKELYSLINERLFEFPICAAEHEDCSQDHAGASGKAITVGEFMTVLGMGHGSVIRVKNRLVKQGTILVTPAERAACIHAKNVRAQKSLLSRLGRMGFTFTYKSYRYIMSIAKYIINDADIAKCFRHLIYSNSWDRATITDVQSTIPQLCGF